MPNHQLFGGSPLGSQKKQSFVGAWIFRERHLWEACSRSGLWSGPGVKVVMRALERTKRSVGPHWCKEALGTSGFSPGFAERKEGIVESGSKTPTRSEDKSLRAQGLGRECEKTSVSSKSKKAGNKGVAQKRTQGVRESTKNALRKAKKGRKRPRNHHGMRKRERARIP